MPCMGHLISLEVSSLSVLPILLGRYSEEIADYWLNGESFRVWQSSKFLGQVLGSIVAHQYFGYVIMGEF